MKLAEALSLRADAQKRLAQLQARAAAAARYQEGEPPADDAAELLATARTVTDELQVTLPARTRRPVCTGR